MKKYPGFLLVLILLAGTVSCRPPAGPPFVLPPVEALPARLGINPTDVSDWATEFIWVDIERYMRVELEGAGFTDAQFDENGYPFSLTAGQQINVG